MIRLLTVPLLLFSVILWSGCARFGDFARERADKEAFKTIQEKQQRAGVSTNTLSLIDPSGATSRTQGLLSNVAHIPLSRETFTTPTYQLSLSSALAIASANNRDYKGQEETLLASALTLSNVRWDFGAQPYATATDSLTRTESGHGISSDASVEKFGTRNFSVGFEKTLFTGAQISMDFTQSFVKYLTGGKNATNDNTLSASVVQPLLRGAGPLVALESLRQAERDAIYSVRSFQRYRQTFAINVATKYYTVLSKRDKLMNALSNYDLAKINWERMKMFRDAGKNSDLEVDQAKQRVLDLESSVASAQSNYQGQLDIFKNYLGIPLDFDLEPDPAELALVAQRGLAKPGIDLQEALDSAVQNRLDLKTLDDKTSDSARQAQIALRNFLPKLDATYNFTSLREDPREKLALRTANNTQVFGFNLSLPFDWTPRRNNYRNALITLDQARRSTLDKQASIIVEVRDAWRELERLRNEYRVQLESLAVAKKRVESTEMLMAASRATTRDVLDAQSWLLIAQNAVTAALIDHTIQRLEFWNAIERLKIDDKGMWNEK